MEGKGAQCVEARAMVREEMKGEEAGEPGSNLDREKQGQDSTRKKGGHKALAGIDTLNITRILLVAKAT